MIEELKRKEKIVREHKEKKQRQRRKEKDLRQKKMRKQEMNENIVIKNGKGKKSLTKKKDE